MLTRQAWLQGTADLVCSSEQHGQGPRMGVLHQVHADCSCSSPLHACGHCAVRVPGMLEPDVGRE